MRISKANACRGARHGCLRSASDHLFLALLLCLALVLGGERALARSASELYTIGPKPDWVSLTTPPEPRPADATNSADGLQYLVVDRQYKEFDTPQYYFRYVYRVENVEGRSDSSDISVSLDPSYEHVTLHDVSIVRDGKRLDRLTDADIAVLHQEDELEKQIYDGGRTLHVLLNDVRVGDIIDYSYTSSGKNPVFENSINLNTTVQWSVPAAYRRLRLLAPNTLDIYTKAHVVDEEPTITRHPRFTEYVWDANNLAAIEDEDSVPDWFPVYPSIQITSFGSWEDVVRDELKIYDIDNPLPEELKSFVDEIREAHEDKEDQLVAALKFVQDEIRYVAIHMGTGGYIPNTPEKTLRRRYGDCKDKTFLLLALMEALEIEGYPVLVDSDEGRGLDQYLPSRGLFDHMIVQAVIGDTVYWLDGTLTHQKGTLENLHQPDYGKALVVREGTTGLVDMNRTALARPQAELHMEIDASSGPGEDIFLTVKTTLRGARASSARSWIDRDLETGVQETYLEYFEGYYESIRVKDPIDIVDREEEDELIITESYVIEDGWEEDDGEWYFPVVNEDFHENIETPDADVRRTPFELSYPVWELHTNTIKLPGEAWAREYDDDVFTLRTDHFKMEATQTIAGNAIEMSRQYRALKDHVVPGDLTSYVRDAEEAQDYSDSRYLYFPVRLTGGSAPPVSLVRGLALSYALPLLAVMGALLGIGFFRRQALRRALRDDKARLMSFRLSPVSETLQIKGEPSRIWQALRSLQFLDGAIRIQPKDDERAWDAFDVREGAEFDLIYRRKRRQPLKATGRVLEFIPEKRMVLRLEPHSLYHNPEFKNYSTESELAIEVAPNGKGVQLELTDNRDYLLTEKLFFIPAREVRYLRRYLRRSGKNVKAVAKRMK